MHDDFGNCQQRKFYFPASPGKTSYFYSNFHDARSGVWSGVYNSFAALHKYSNPSLIESEKEAWANAAAEKWVQNDN